MNNFSKIFSIEQFNDKLVDVLSSGIYIIAVIVIGLLASKIIRRLITKIIRPGKVKNNVIMTEKRAQTLRSILTSAVKYGIYFIIIYAVSGVLVKQGANPLLAVAGAIGVALGLGAQDLIKDVIAGFFIVLEDHFSIGDIIEVGSQMGTVHEIGIRTTKLKGFSGQLFILPNGSIQMVTNWSRGQTKAAVNIAVSYGEDMDRIIALLERVMESAEGSIDDIIGKPVVMGITELGDYSIKIRIMADCKPGTHWSVERELRLNITKLFTKEGIKPPYPKTEIISPNH